MKQEMRYVMRRKCFCLDCNCVIKEDNEFEAYDEKGNDAIWDDSRKGWVCVGCKYE